MLSLITSYFDVKPPDETPNITATARRVPSFARPTASSSTKAEKSTIKKKNNNKLDKKTKSLVRVGDSSQDKSKGKGKARQLDQWMVQNKIVPLIEEPINSDTHAMVHGTSSPPPSSRLNLNSSSSPIPSTSTLSGVIAKNFASLDVGKIASSEGLVGDQSEEMEKGDEMQLEGNLLNHSKRAAVDSLPFESISPRMEVEDGLARVGLPSDLEEIADSQEFSDNLLAGKRIASSPRHNASNLLPQGPALTPLSFKMQVDSPFTKSKEKAIGAPVFYTPSRGVTPPLPSPPLSPSLRNVPRTRAEVAEFARLLSIVSTPNSNTRSFEPEYVTSPTGSLLSSLLPSREPSQKPYALIPHSFTLEVEALPQRTRSRSGSAAVSRSGRSKNGEQKRSGESSRAGEKNLERNGNSGPSRSRAESARPSQPPSKAGSTGGSRQPSRGGSKEPSRAGSVGVSAEVEEEVESSDSASEPEFDFFAEAMARAKQLKAMENSSASPTTVIPTPLTDRSISPASRYGNELRPVRESAKKRRKTTNWDPVAKASHDALLALQRQSKTQKRAGWEGEAAALELLDSNPFLDSDQSDEELAPISASQLESIALNFDNDEDQTASAKKKSNHFKSKIVENLKLTRPEPISFQEDIPNRIAWNEIHSVSIFVILKVNKAGWKKRVVESFSVAVANGTSVSTSLLFSQLTGIGSREDRVEIAKWLLSLVAHPTTAVVLADSAIHLLLRIFSHEAKNGLIVLKAEDFLNQLGDLGFKDDTLGSEGVNSSQRVEISLEERNACVVRLLRVLRDVSTLSSQLLCAEDLVQFSTFLIRIAMDPSASPFERLIDIILPQVFDAAYASSNSDLCHSLIIKIVNSYYEKSRATQLVLLRILPFKSKSNKIFSKWISFCLLSEEEGTQRIMLDTNIIFQSPGLELYQTILQTSTFAVPPPSARILLDSVLCFQFLCSDLFESLSISESLGDRSTAELKWDIEAELVRIRIGLNIRAGLGADPTQSKIYNLGKLISSYNFLDIDKPKALRL